MKVNWTKPIHFGYYFQIQGIERCDIFLSLQIFQIEKGCRHEYMKFSLLSVVIEGIFYIHIIRVPLKCKVVL